METFSALLALCAGNSPVPGDFPSQSPVLWGFDVFFNLRPNKRLSKQSWGWWFETPLCSLWRHCNVSSDMDELVCYLTQRNTQKRATDVIALYTWPVMLLWISLLFWTPRCLSLKFWKKSRTTYIKISGLSHVYWNDQPKLKSAWT